MQNHDRRLPIPPIDEDVDVRSLSWMPVDYSVVESDLALQGTFADMGAGWMLMFLSWHQVPAGSIPSDDLKIAQMLGIAPRSRDLPEDHEDPAVRAGILARWLRMKKGALLGWTLHSDERWYHPMMAEKAVSRYAAYASKKENAKATNRKKRGNLAERYEERGTKRNEERNAEYDAERYTKRHAERDDDNEITEKSKKIDERNSERDALRSAKRNAQREEGYQEAIEGATFKNTFGYTPQQMADEAWAAADQTKLVRRSPALEQVTFFASIIERNQGLCFRADILSTIAEITYRPTTKVGSISRWDYFGPMILERFQARLEGRQASFSTPTVQSPSPFVYKLGTKQSQRHWDRQKSCPEDYTNCDDCLDKRHGDNRYWNDKTFGEWKKLITDWERDPATWPKELTFKPDQFGTKVPDHLLMELDKYDYERGRPLFLKTASTSQVQAPTPRSAAPPPVLPATNGVGHPAVTQPADDFGEPGEIPW